MKIKWLNVELFVVKLIICYLASDSVSQLLSLLRQTKFLLTLNNNHYWSSFPGIDTNSRDCVEINCGSYKNVTGSTPWLAGF